MRPEELERIRTSDNPQIAAFKVGYNHGYEGKPNGNPFIEGGELHGCYEMGFNLAHCHRLEKETA